MVVCLHLDFSRTMVKNVFLYLVPLTRIGKERIQLYSRGTGAHRLAECMMSLTPHIWALAVKMVKCKWVDEKLMGDIVEQHLKLHQLQHHPENT